MRNLATIWAAALLLTGGACASAFRPASRDLAFTQHLHLTVTPDTTTATIGERLGVLLTLSNDGRRLVSVCIGGGRTYLLTVVRNRDGSIVPRDDRPAVDEQFARVDPPYGATPVMLRPGGHVSWREDVLVRDIGAGDAHLSVAVKLHHPDDCPCEHPSSCGSIELLSSAPFEEEDRSTLQLRREPRSP